MICPHVHFRDGPKQSHKETVLHGLMVAYLVGLDGVFDQSNTDPPLTSRNAIAQRIELGDRAIDDLQFDIFYGVYGGVTEIDGEVDENQIKEVVWSYGEMFPRQVGIKLFAGHSTGNLGVITEKGQRTFFRTIAKEGYKGVVAVHCEKEEFLRKIPGGKPDWDPTVPITHATARTAIAELRSVQDIVNYAASEGFQGTLHICHISVPEALLYIESMRSKVDFKITCGLTPHHALCYADMMIDPYGLLLKMNPPLREASMSRYMLDALLDGRIDWIETDHAPHKKNEKMQEPFASGIPVLPYYPHFIKMLRKRGLPPESLAAVTHDNIVKAFGLEGHIADTKRYEDVRYDLALNEFYDFDPFARLKRSGR